MFGLRINTMSVDEFIIHYTEYILGRKEEKYVYLTEKYVDYVSHYVYPILQETASWVADVTSYAFNKVYTTAIFASDTIFNLMAVSSDFLGDFSKVQLACIAVLAFLLFGLNKSIRTSRKLKKDLRTYQSMLKHVNWQYEAAKPEMKEITDRLTKNRDEKIPQANKQLEKIYTLIDKKYRIQEWSPLIMEEVRKLHHYNAVWENGGESEGIEKVRELGRHVDFKIAKIRNRVEALKRNLEDRKQPRSNLRFNEMPQDAQQEAAQPPRCDSAAEPVFCLAHGDTENNKPLVKEEIGDDEDSWGDMNFSTLSWAEQVEEAERQELEGKISCEKGAVEAGGAKNEDGGDQWNDISLSFSSLSWAEQVEEAERLESGEHISREEEADVVEAGGTRNEDGGDQWDDIHFSSLSWAEQVDEAESLGLL